MAVTTALRLLEDAIDRLKTLPLDSTIQEALAKIGEAVSEINEVWGKEEID